MLIDTALGRAEYEQWRDTLSASQKELIDKAWNEEDVMNTALALQRLGYVGTQPLLLGGIALGMTLYYFRGQAVTTLPDSSDAGLTLEQQYASNPVSQALYDSSIAGPEGVRFVSPDAELAAISAVHPSGGFFGALGEVLQTSGPALVAAGVLSLAAAPVLAVDAVAPAVGGEVAAQQAIDAIAQTLYDAAAVAGVPGYDAALTSGVAAGGATGSSLAEIAQVFTPPPELPAPPVASAPGPDVAAQQAIDASAQTIYDAAAAAGVPGYDAALTSGVAAGGAAGSSLAEIAQVFTAPPPLQVLTDAARVIKAGAAVVTAAAPIVADAPPPRPPFVVEPVPGTPAAPRLDSDRAWALAGLLLGGALLWWAVR